MITLVDEYGVRENIVDEEPLFKDKDGDELDDLLEIQFGTNASDDDCDDDGLNDFEELFPMYAFNQDNYAFVLLASDPLKVDTDNDGLNDTFEMLSLSTNPNYFDTDNDGYSDYIEFLNGTDPLNATEWPGFQNNSPPNTSKDSEQIDLIEPDRSILAIPGYPLEIVFLSI